MKSLVILLSVILTVFGCKSSQIEDVENTKIPFIKLKSGGGFAGKYTTYLLFENGQIFEQKSEMSPSEPAGSINKDQAKQIFSNYNVLNLAAVDYKKSGNYTYTIVKQSGDEKHLISWEKDQEGTDMYQVFYKNAMQAIKTSKNFKPEKPAEKQ